MMLQDMVFQDRAIAGALVLSDEISSDVIASDINHFGKTSTIKLCAAAKDGQTFMEDVSFSAPYKIMAPFVKENGGIRIMPLCASAGIMQGDRQEFFYHAKEGADLELLSQSFEKIHKMDSGSASRRIRLQIDQNAVVCYSPQPVIPFGGSAFDSDMEIHLADKSSRLFLLDILSCGRAAHGERFAYRRFSSRVCIYRGKKLIYRDNTRYEPDKMPMEGIGMYEGYTHMANLFLSVMQEDHADKIRTLLYELLEAESECTGGITRLFDGDLCIRILGNRAQLLQ